jgi:hypothetical protein
VLSEVLGQECLIVGFGACFRLGCATMQRFELDFAAARATLTLAMEQLLELGFGHFGQPAALAARLQV